MDKREAKRYACRLLASEIDRALTQTNDLTTIKIRSGDAPPRFNVADRRRIREALREITTELDHRGAVD